jgi:hypothetical protein
LYAPGEAKKLAKPPRTASAFFTRRRCSFAGPSHHAKDVAAKLEALAKARDAK